MRTAKFYRLSTHHPDVGCVLSWHRRRRDAVAELNNEIAIHGEENVAPWHIEKVEIELSTDGIIHWLNRNFTTDNG